MQTDASVIVIEALLILISLGLAVAAIGLTGLALFERWFRGGRRAIGRMAAAILALAALMVAADAVMAVNLRNRLQRPSLQIDLLERSGLWEARYPGGVAATELHVPVGEAVAIASAGQTHVLLFPRTAFVGSGQRGHRAQWLMQIDRGGLRRGVSVIARRQAIVPVTIIGESRSDFDRWLLHEAEPAPAPATPAAARGRAIFFTARCAHCHVVRGIWEVAEEPAPDLTHLASRMMIAGRVPNRKGFLAGWIVDPQSVDPGTTMPPNAIDPQALSDLLAFLETLK